MRILFIRYKKSGKVLEGGEQCSSRNYNVIAQLVGSDNVTTYYIHDETRRRKLGEYIKGIWYFPQHYYFGLTPRRVNQICRMANDFDAVWVDRSVFGIICKKLKSNGYKGRIMSFFHNVETMYFDAKLKPSMPFRNVVIGCADKNDGYVCQYSDSVVALNNRDSMELGVRYGRKADVLAPIAFADTYQRSLYPTELTSSKPLCIFLGGYFTANNEGIEWFVKNVYPHVNIRFRIVGKGMEKIKSCEWLSSDIEVVPNAPDLLPHFEEADIMVLPIFKGGGMKVKTCESLMYGKNILATDESWEGYDLDCEKAGGRCNTAQDFIDRINAISAHPIPRFNAYSRSVFVERYSEDVVKDKFRTALFG